ncbi:MAG: hypothetical protein AAB802_00125, partial [Patescibacteria group bacterium]
MTASANPPLGMVDMGKLWAASKGPEEFLATLGQIESQIRRAMIQAVPEVELDVRTARREMPGLLPVGMKCHTPASMNAARFETHQALFEGGGLKTTSFKLIHGGETLVMPPVPTPLEARYLLGTFHTFGTINDDDPGIQLALGGGRWTPERAAVVGSSVLLSNPGGLEYASGAFGTTHAQTESRIMVYDAGVKLRGLPYDLPTAVGRTDMLEQIHGDSLDRYQLLGTLASHHQHDGRLATLWGEYVANYERILRQNGLYGALRESAWVASVHQEGDNVERHEAMVGQFTRACNENPRLRQQVRRLIVAAGKKVRALKAEIVRENPGEFEHLLNY